MEQPKIANLNFPKTTYFRGMLFTRIEDFGPDITANLTTLEEGQALSLAVQTFTMIGVGTGSRSSGSWIGNVFGPMPVPTGQLTNCLIYPFLIDDQSSNDSRIRSAGRSCAVIILISRQMEKYDDLRSYLTTYLSNWIKDKKFTDENFKQLFYTIQKHETLENKEEDKAKTQTTSKIDNQDTKDLIKKMTNKIALLEHLVGMDSLGKALATMYETNPDGSGTIDQLAKMAGMSRIMIGWNLRKYVKNGLLQIDNNNIFFLK